MLEQLTQYPYLRDTLVLLDILNLTANAVFSWLSRGRIFTSTFIVERALGGSKARNERAVFARTEKGLNRVLTSVKNRVIMLAVEDDG